MSVVTLLEAEYSLGDCNGTHTVAVGEASESGAAFEQFRVALNDLLSSKIDAAAAPSETGRKRPVEEEVAVEEPSSEDTETE